MDYYDNLRQDTSLIVNQVYDEKFDFSKRSSLVEIIEPKTNKSIRLGHVSALLPLSWFGESPTEDANDLTLAVFMAIHHFNNRDSSIVPELKSPRLQNCNIKLTWDLRDGARSAATTSRLFLTEVMASAPDGYKNSTSLLIDPLPIAVVGAMWSTVTSPLSKLAGALEIPVISPAASSTEFDSKIDHPYFARTVPSIAAWAVALVDYLVDIIGINHLGVLFDNASYAQTFAKAIIDYAAIRGVDVLDIPVTYYADKTTTAQIKQAMKSFRSKKFRYFFHINFDMVYSNEVMLEAYNSNLTGPEYSWWMSDGISFRDFENKAKYFPDDPLVEAMDGIGFIHLLQPQFFTRYKEFSEQWNLFGQDQDVVEYLRQKQPMSLKLLLQKANITHFDYQESPDVGSLFVYDAVMAVGMGACDSRLNQASSTFNENASYMFTGPELFASMTSTSFDGASNHVSFLPGTGNRDFSDDLLFLANLRRNAGLNTDGMVSSTLHPTAAYVKAENSSLSGLRWRPIQPFVFSDGTIVPPLDLPRPNENVVLISEGALIGGLIMASLALTLSLACGIWTVIYRKEKIVQASQPEFMIMICIGCLIMASSVIPLSLQESAVTSTQVLNMACMTTPWLLCTGFVTSFSVLFAKTLRLNKLVLAGSFRKVVVRVQDVLMPFILLLLTNIVILTVWTIVAPLRWMKFDFLSTDEFGRSIESKSMCSVPQGDDLAVILCVLALAVINLLSVVLAAHQSYLCRNVKLQFNESGQMFLVLMSILQTAIIALPVFMTVLQTPSARFVVYSMLVSVLCCSILLPLFVRNCQSKNSSKVILVLSKTSAEALRKKEVSSQSELQICKQHDSIIIDLLNAIEAEYARTLRLKDERNLLCGIRSTNSVDNNLSDSSLSVFGCENESELHSEESMITSEQEVEDDQHMREKVRETVSFNILLPQYEFNDVNEDSL